MASFLAQGFHADSFRCILPDQSIGIFTGSPFPSGMWMGKVDQDALGVFQGEELIEFSSIITGEAEDSMVIGDQEVNDLVGDGGGGAIS